MLEAIVSAVIVSILGGIGFLIKHYFFSNNKEGNTSSPEVQTQEQADMAKSQEENIYELRKKVKILFIDDDTKFQTAKMLKSSGWENINIIKDCKNLNSAEIINTDIFFIDIHGVGIELGFKEHGLGLAEAIKKKYPSKKVVIYSSERNWDSFHPAWDMADDRLHKDADTYQFESVIENLLLD